MPKAITATKSNRFILVIVRQTQPKCYKPCTSTKTHTTSFLWLTDRLAGAKTLAILIALCGTCDQYEHRIRTCEGTQTGIVLIYHTLVAQWKCRVDRCVSRFNYRLEDRPECFHRRSLSRLGDDRLGGKCRKTTRLRFCFGSWAPFAALSSCINQSWPTTCIGFTKSAIPSDDIIVCA
jgi:hypothetical protein